MGYNIIYIQAACEDEDGKRSVVAGVPADVLLDTEPSLGRGRRPRVGRDAGGTDEVLLDISYVTTP